MNAIIEPLVEGDSPLPSHTLCPACGALFKLRRNKTYCSPRCRKTASKRKQRRQAPANATYSFIKAREQHEKFELAERMAETLYTMPPGERLGYIETIIQLARNGYSPKVRDILTTPQLIKPNPRDRYLFYRGRPQVYCTIAQAANRYTIWSPWRSSVDRVVKGFVDDPPTGEVFDDGNIDDGRGFLSSRKSVDTPTIEQTYRQPRPIGGAYYFHKQRNKLNDKNTRTSNTSEPSSTPSDVRHIPDRGWYSRLERTPQRPLQKRTPPTKF